jgi:hypothetical protein
MAADGAGVDMARRSLPMSEPMSPEWRRARAQKAARERWHGADADVIEPAAELERDRIDRQIDALVARAPRMTPEQADRLRRLFKYGPAEGGASG